MSRGSSISSRAPVASRPQRRGAKGSPSFLDGEPITGAFRELDHHIECVVLESCYTLERADRLVLHVECLVGTLAEVDGGRAIDFYSGFYAGLASGKRYYEAFEQAREAGSAVGLTGTLTPRFNTRDVASLEPSSRRRSRAESPVYPLWYGTNRKPVNPGDPGSGYSGERDTRIHYGTCGVTVPRSHRIGEVGSSWWTRLIRRTDDRLQLVPESLTRLREGAFWQGLREALLERDEGERMAFVFIHGYNVSFENAAIRAAQIGYDLQVPGIMAFYSWPSKGTYVGYPADEDAILTSEVHLTEFLTRFVQDTGAERVHILAHSMGNRGLLRSLRGVVQRSSREGSRPFEQIFLAAPDVDSLFFSQNAEHFQSAANHTTLYVSSRDKALASSGLIHDNDRAGYLPPVLVVDGIDTIVASAIDVSFLGHGYFAEARPILVDINSLMHSYRKPNLRIGMEQAQTADGRDYWVLQS